LHHTTTEHASSGVVLTCVFEDQPLVQSPPWGLWGDSPDSGFCPLASTLTIPRVPGPSSKQPPSSSCLLPGAVPTWTLSSPEEAWGPQTGGGPLPRAPGSPPAAPPGSLEHLSCGPRKPRSSWSPAQQPGDRDGGNSGRDHSRCPDCRWGRPGPESVATETQKTQILTSCGDRTDCPRQTAC
ncbi:unnamed protein product, partial [Gulo gulo]